MESTERDLAIECAPCSRIAEALLAWLLKLALEQPGSAFLWTGSRTNAMKQRLGGWLDQVGDKRAWGVELPNRSRIVFAGADKLEDVSGSSLSAAVVAEAHEAPDPRAYLAQMAVTTTRFVGQLAAPTHWFGKLCRQLEGTPAYHRVDDQTCLRRGVVTEDYLERVRTSVPRAAYSRMYRLRPDQQDGSEQSYLTFARKRLRIRDVHGTVVPFDLRDVQKTYVAFKRMKTAQLRAQGLPVKFLLLKYRRGGFTTVEQGQSYKQTATRSNQQAVTLAHTQQATAQIFRIAQLMHRDDPEAPRLRGVGNAQRLEFPDLNSVFFIGTAGSSGFGRGDTFQRVHGCLAAGSPIITRDGSELDITEVEVGSEVITHTGAKTVVRDIVKKAAIDVPGNGELVKVVPWKGASISMTPDHQVLTRRGWVRADELMLSDHVMMPVREITRDITEKDGLQLDEASGFTVGYYLAEGSIGHCGLKLDRHRSERHYGALAAAGVSEMTTSISYRDKCRDEGDGGTTYLYGKKLASLFDQLFGRAKTKRVPDWAFQAGEGFCRGLLKGYLCGDATKTSPSSVEASSVCSGIALQIRDLAASLGYGWAGCGRRGQNGWRLQWNGRDAFALRELMGLPVHDCPTRDWVHRYEIDDSGVWMKIRKLSRDVADFVYDLVLDHPDHSFRTHSFVVHNSEVSKWAKGPKGHDTVRDLVAGLTEAASHGEVVLETTPNGNEWFAETYRDAVARRNDWTTIFLPWFWDPTYRMQPGTFSVEEVRDTLTDRERHLVEVEHLDWSQIAWRRMKMRGVGQLFVQEYPEDPISCFITSGMIFFDTSRVLDLIEEVPQYEVVPIGSYGYEVVWVPPVPGHEYVVCADTSEGIPGDGASKWFSGDGASDPNGLGVLDLDTGEQVAALHGIFEPAELALHCKRFAAKYNEAVVAPERNNHGHAVIAKLQDGDSQAYWPNLYFHDDGRAGWPTNSATRPVMLSEFREAIDEGYMVVRDRHMLDECLTFKKQRNGKWEAAGGDHDDTLFKWMIGWQVRQRPRAKSEVIVLGDE